MFHPILQKCFISAAYNKKVFHLFHLICETLRYQNSIKKAEQLLGVVAVKLVISPLGLGEKQFNGVVK